MYQGMWDCFKKTYKAEGYFGMYRGSAVNIILVRIALTSSEFFQTHVCETLFLESIGEAPYRTPIATSMEF